MSCTETSSTTTPIMQSTIDTRSNTLLSSIRCSRMLVYFKGCFFFFFFFHTLSPPKIYHSEHAGNSYYLLPFKFPENKEESEIQCYSLQSGSLHFKYLQRQKLKTTDTSQFLNSLTPVVSRT